jgi:5'-phosphate synthase pdxT subunit
MILLAKNIRSNGKVETLGVMNIEVTRNAFGRQKDSFETELNIPALGEAPFPGVFIRPPIIGPVSSEVEIIARLDDGTAVAARQGKLLACAFHPELTRDTRFHKYFLDIITGRH